MISQSCNISCWETETGEPGIQGHSWVWNESEASLDYMRPCLNKKTILLNCMLLMHRNTVGEPCPKTLSLSLFLSRKHLKYGEIPRSVFFFCEQGPIYLSLLPITRSFHVLICALSLVMFVLLFYWLTISSDVCACVCVCRHTCATMHTWMSWNNFQELIISFLYHWLPAFQHG